MVVLTIQCMDFWFPVNERVVKTLETNCIFTLVQLEMLQQPDTKPSPHEVIIDDQNLKRHLRLSNCHYNLLIVCLLIKSIPSLETEERAVGIII
jgi:hypothetical protein